MSACDQVWSRLAAGDPLPALLISHVAECPACRRAAAADAWMARRTHKKVSLSAALRGALAADPGPVALHGPLWRAVPSIVVAFAAVATTTLLAPMRSDVGGLVGCGLLGLTAAVGIGLVFHRGRDGLGPSVPARWSYVVIALALFGVVTMGSPTGRGDPVTTTMMATAHRPRPQISGAVSQGWSSAGHTPDERSTPLGAGGSASYALVLTLLMGATLLSGARRTTPVAPGVTGLCGGIAAGLVAATAIELHDAASAHTLLAHGLPVGLGVLLGATVGRRILSP